MTNEYRDLVQHYLNLIYNQIIPGFEFDIDREGEQWRFNLITTLDTELAVGKEGETLRSVQHLVRVLAHRKFPEDRTHFLLDINGYRRNREYAISVKIPEIAQSEVLANGNTVILVGLSGYERLQVHKILSEIKGLNTNSVGPEGNRKLLIMPTSETGSGSMDTAKIIHINQIKA